MLSPEVDQNVEGAAAIREEIEKKKQEIEKKRPEIGKKRPETEKKRQEMEVEASVKPEIKMTKLKGPEIGMTNTTDPETEVEANVKPEIGMTDPQETEMKGDQVLHAHFKLSEFFGINYLLL